MIKYCFSLGISLLFCFSISAQSINKLVEGNSEFAIELYKNLSDSKNNENLFFSPYSISQAMAIAQLGASNKTAEEIASVMHFPIVQSALHADFKELSNKLKNSFDSIVLKSANSLWAQKGYSFKKEYIDGTKKFYNAPCNYLNYKKKGARKKAVGIINEWTLENTNNQISDFLKNSDVNKETRLVIVNAIWFKGDWAAAFNKKRTKERLFKSPNGEQKTLFIQNEAKYWYYDDDMIQVLRLPYKGNKQSMLFFLPLNSKDLSKFETNFDVYYLKNILKDMNEVKIDVRIPKFENEYSINLTEVMKDLGIEQAFTDYADFSGMTEKNDLKVDKIIHKAKIEINEEGSEAAAATAVTMIRKTAVINPLIFNADHPFIYMVRDEVTGSILFLGRLMSAE